MSIYISASSIKEFIQCPQKVLYRITKPFPVLESKEMVIGKAVHSIFEKGWTDREKALEVMKQEIDRYKLGKADATNLSFYVDLFFLNFRHMLHEDDQIEYSFKIPIQDNVFLVGKMDRISRGNIFDWKSGGKLPKSISNDVQCMIYDFAYRAIFNKEPSSVCLVGLGEGRLVPFTKNEVFYRELFTSIIPRMIKTIKSESYERLGMFNHGCFRCQYKQGCLGKVEVDE